MGCINKPITIPKGADGVSCKIAFASDSSGTGFSYTQSAALQYMSVVCKTGSFAATDFTVWVKYVGTAGTDGDDGLGISNVFVSDGTTAIGGTVYPVNTLVTFMTNGTYINAGLIVVNTLSWVTLPLVNGWAAHSKGPVMYAIDNNNMLHLRGILVDAGTTNVIFANLTMGLSNDTQCVISDCDLTTPIMSQMILSTGNTLSITEYALGNGNWYLDSMPLISLR